MTGERVLLVEDEEQIRKLISVFLIRRGYEVDIACDGEEALSMLAVTAPDLIITDLSMPRLSGPQLIERLRNMSATAHLPVILVSSQIPAEAAAVAAESGADVFVGKPLDMRRLEACVVELLAARRMSS